MIKKIGNVIEKIGDKDFELESVELNEDLPLIYLETFKFFKCRIFQFEYILVYIDQEKIENIDLEKVVKYLWEIRKIEIILFLNSSFAQQRLYLRNKHISYIDMKGNYFLYPRFLFEHERLNSSKQIEKLSLNAQIILLYFLNIKQTNVDVENLKDFLQLKEMSISRGLNELLQLELLSYEVSGHTHRKRIYKIDDCINTFKKAQKYLSNPIKRIVYTDEKNEDVIYTSDSALAISTLLNEPDIPMFALFHKQFNIKELYRGQYLIELWSYDPRLFMSNNCVDKFSLSLIFRNSEDPRVLEVLEELMNTNDKRD